MPLVLVPGITGSKLRRVADGRLIWGEGRQLVRPKDGGYSLVRPIHEPIDGASPRVEAFALLDNLRVLGLLEKPVYAPVVRLLEEEGYVLGNPLAPSPEATLYLFPYDWRGDNILAAQALRRLLEGIAKAQGGKTAEPAPTDLICQSNGAHICRYLVKYGATDLEEAEARLLAPADSRRAGEATPYRVRKLVMVGTSNGGGIRILRDLERGRRYVPVVGRFMRPEVPFTFPALYQDLPFYEPNPFIDRGGKRLEIDLFDADTWVRHGWSVFDPAVATRLEARPELFGSADQRRAFLATCLDRGRRLHRLLADDPEHLPTSPPSYYLLQNGYYPTPHLAVLESDGTLLFTGDAELEDQPYLSALITAPGDGHATLESQMALSPIERTWIAEEPLLVQGGHFELFLDPGTLRRLTDFLELADD